MKVIVIGAGIGGLSTYHAFHKYLPSVTIDIYDAYPSPLRSNKLIGGGISLGPNGQRAMAAVVPSALSFIRERGFECSTVIFRNQAGKVLGKIPFGSKERYKYGQLMTTRSVVHEALLIEDDMDVKVHWNMKVSRIWETDDEVHVKFEDGTVEKCNLLIGADGARSVTRNAIFGKEYARKYDGLTDFGGFVPLSEFTPSTRENIIKDALPSITMGRVGSFGYSLMTPLDSPEPKLLWFSQAEIDNPPPRDTPRIDMMPLLMQRHGSWKSKYDDPSDPEKTLFRQIITLACAGKEDNNWLMLPRSFTPLLPHWTSLHGLSASGSESGAPTTKAGGRIILMGDAAHTMPPEGVQDSSENEAIEKAAKLYEDIRVTRVNKILVDAKRKAEGKREVGWLQDKIREIVVWVIRRANESGAMAI